MIKKALLLLLCICLLATVVACKRDPAPTPTPTPTPDSGAHQGGADGEEEGTLRFTYPIAGTDVTVEVHQGGSLYVKGTGAVPDYDYAYDQPWYEHGGNSPTERSDAEGGTLLVKAVIVEEGITGIGENAFSEMARLETVSLPSTLRVIAYKGFASCRNLHTVTGGNGLTTIEASAFRDCNQLATIELSAALTLVEESAFDDLILPGVSRSLAVTFRGNETAWHALIDGAGVQLGNDALKNATVTYAP